jgi:glycosyltransferase involved in cell wall biosynthesis
VRVSVVLVDNGEQLLERSVASIRSQTARPHEVIIAPGPRTDLDLARRLADTVLEPCDSIGYARYLGLLRASGDVVMLADSDTIYGENYLRYALEDISRGYQLAKAGTVYPVEPSDPLWFFEHMLFAIGGAWEFGWVVVREELLRLLTPELVERLRNPRADLGHIAYWNPLASLDLRLRSTVDHRMVLWTRMPTHFTRSYLVPAVGATLVTSVVPAVVGYATLRKLLGYA